MSSVPERYISCLIGGQNSHDETLIHSGSRHIVGAQGRRKLWVNQLGKEQCIRWDVHSVAYNNNNNNNKHGDLSKPVVFPLSFNSPELAVQGSAIPWYFIVVIYKMTPYSPDIILTIQAWRSSKQRKRRTRGIVTTLRSASQHLLLYLISQSSIPGATACNTNAKEYCICFVFAWQVTR